MDADAGLALGRDLVENYDADIIFRIFKKQNKQTNKQEKNNNKKQTKNKQKKQKTKNKTNKRTNCEA